jgi:K+-sensing histidine kinase KdpD
MGFVKRFVPIALSLTIALVITVAICWIESDTIERHHLIFLYLLPTTCVAFLYGSMPAIVLASVAMACSAFFFYDPIYSFLVADPRDMGELICFAGLALIGTKCVAELTRPIDKPQDEKTSIRYWENVTGRDPL